MDGSKDNGRVLAAAVFANHSVTNSIHYLCCRFRVLVAVDGVNAFWDGTKHRREEDKSWVTVTSMHLSNPSECYTVVHRSVVSYLE